MRVIGSFLGILASIATVTSAMVRLWWSKPRTSNAGPQDTPAAQRRAPSWAQTAAKWWLIVVAGVVAFGVIIFAAITIINLST